MTIPCIVCSFPLPRICMNHYTGEDIDVPILGAAEKGHLECLKAWIEGGADANDISESLLFATENGHADCIQELLAAGADTEFSSMTGKTPLAAVKNNRCASILLQAGASEVTAIKHVLENGESHVLNILLSCGIDVNATVSGSSYLVYGAEWLMKRLKVEQDNIFITYCCLHDHMVKCIKMLIDQGIKVNVGIPFNVTNITSEIARNSNAKLGFKYLHGAGEIASNLKHRDAPQFVKTEIVQNINLRHLCREKVRSHLLSVDPYTNLYYQICKFPVDTMPFELYDYLLYGVHRVERYYVDSL